MALFMMVAIASIPLLIVALPFLFLVDLIFHAGLASQAWELLLGCTGIFLAPFLLLYLILTTFFG